MKNNTFKTAFIFIIRNKCNKICQICILKTANVESEPKYMEL